MHYLLRLLLVLFGFSLLTVCNCYAQTISPAVARQSATPQMQIVRLSYVQGDVKDSMGLNGTPDLDNAEGAEWPQRARSVGRMV